MSGDYPLASKVAVVTGGSRGIGRASAELLASRGAAVVVLGKTDELRARTVAADISKQFGVEAIGLVADATSSTDVQRCYRDVHARFGQLDVLVNNAGILEDALIGMISSDLVSRLLQVNVAGAIQHLQVAARMMKRQGSGSIVNLSSIIGRVGNAGQIAYAASKAAVIGVTYSAAKELAPCGVRVNAVAPGFIDTDMTRALPTQVFSDRASSIAMGRIGNPADVAKVIGFLASDDSSYVTGQVIGVDGGMLI